MTNYERIKNMSIDEMAKYFYKDSIRNSPITLKPEYEDSIINIYRKWLNCENELMSLEEYKESI